MMRKFLILSMARSTWIRTVAMRRVDRTSPGSSWLRPPRKGGTLVDTPGGNISSMSIPLSAMIESLGSNLCSNPLRLVISLSLIRPPYRSETLKLCCINHDTSGLELPERLRKATPHISLSGPYIHLLKGV